MAWTYPHEFHDGIGETASGVQVNDNFGRAKEKIEALEALNAGRPTDYAFSELNTSRALSTTFTPSASRPTLVYLSMRANPTAARAQVTVDGVPLYANGGVDLTAGQVVAVSFPVKAGGTWKCEAAAGPMDLLVSTYLLLPKT